ncbi:ABC transporter ATP-binding protein/permease [Bombilactobacillus folatiphilus]|uniref:ABC transporter ATP-binding protein/permease n=1 Tax=Bombilactobacillus folatiphilus TaxID=2923362 RepID=A0ABY4P7F9_9LACO|nr:ABC transporter ATP-binding protein [Bombilactobacillus folatiphilus]UQS81520.1 ABC transporter ATP-binding protein/permease [Bombilactobacillus folatiphilus]
MQSFSSQKLRSSYHNLMTLIHTIKPNYWQLIVGIALGTISILIQLVVPVIVKQLVDMVQKSLAHVDVRLVILGGGLFLLSTLIGAVSGSFLGFFGEEVVFKLRLKLWNKLLNVPLGYFDQKQSGEIASRITNDANQVKDLLANSLPKMLTSLLQLVGALLFMLAMDWRLTIVLFIAVPLLVVILLPVFHRSTKIASQRQNLLAQFNGKISEMIGEITLVKSDNAEKLEYQSVHKQLQKLYHVGRLEAVYDAIVGPVTGIVMLVTIVSILLYGEVRIKMGTLDMGTLLAFMMYLVQLMVPFTTLGQFLTDLAKVDGSTIKIRALLDELEEDQTKGQLIDYQAQELIFQDVKFAYPDGRQALNGLNLQIQPQTTVAFVGPSGSGKTTIFNLLEGFYQPHHGQLQIGTTNLKDVNLASWRQQLGLVDQNSAAVTGTIRDNLTYGLTKHYSDQQLWQALTWANAKDFVKQLPQQLASSVGEHGMNLSGGQRQRLAIARVFLRDPKILLLDEATASLDLESETLIQKSLQQLMVGRTTLIIAHRLNTIINADRIYFVKNGQVQSFGTHTELLQNYAPYQAYFQDQFLKSAAN